MVSRNLQWSRQPCNGLDKPAPLPIDRHWYRQKLQWARQPLLQRSIIEPMPNPDSLIISDLRESYRTGRRTPSEVMGRLLEKPAGADERNVWITRLSRDQVMAYVSALDPGAIDRLPLYGIPFVVKDNIDLAAVPTTAGCPRFAYTPPHSATVVQKLVAAGA